MTDGKKIDDGGPAFPWKVSIPSGSRNPISNRVVPVGQCDNEIFPGMSLRDWFAGQALAGQLANVSRVGDFAKRSRAAEEAYHWADAMIAARKAGA
ncbi:hypothetical protein [Shinella sp.]|uniref:hypothetical protein n=1 Tax=Shinella sp. TaxID=1870904 RepID=UPI003D2BD5E4